MALKGSSCLSMGWTAQSWSVQGRCVSSNSLKRFCSCSMWRMQSSMSILLSWEVSSSSYVWPLTLSSATRSSQSDRFSSAHLQNTRPPLDSFLCRENLSRHVGVCFISFYMLLLSGQNKFWLCSPASWWQSFKPPYSCFTSSRTNVCTKTEPHSATRAVRFITKRSF